ncbi:dihydrolipoyl dehydrogenase, partial [Buchnera aphidicola (Hormaphis cornu)]
LKLPGVSYSDSRVWNSTDALKLSFIPRRLLIIGGGIIGLEMASVYSALGSTIDIVDSIDQVLSLVDIDIINQFNKITSMDFNLVLNTKILKVDSKEDGLWVTMQTKNLSPSVIRYDAILIAIGRGAPCYLSLDIDKIGIVQNTSGFITVDAQLRTNKSHVYAIGDVLGPPMLAHKGIYQGKLVAEIISGKTVFYDPMVVPSIAYTDPEVAWVGITEKEAERKKINYAVSVFPWKASGRAMVSIADQGCTKLIFSKDSHRIIGGTIIGSNAGELLGEITLAIEMGCEAEDISLTMHAHPTLYETIGVSSEIFQGISIDI